MISHHSAIIILYFSWNALQALLAKHLLKDVLLLLRSSLEPFESNATESPSWKSFGALSINSCFESFLILSSSTILYQSSFGLSACIANFKASAHLKNNKEMKQFTPKMFTQKLAKTLSTLKLSSNYDRKSLITKQSNKFLSVYFQQRLKNASSL